MYQPLFREDRLDVMQDLISAQPLATLVSSAAGQIQADHVPLVLHADQSDKGVLRGHVAKGNGLWRSRAELESVMAIFQGPQSYVTPSWYPSKQEHGKVVPTWNYVVVHARGAFRFVDDADWLMAHLGALTRQHEQDRAKPWAVSDAPADYLSRQLRGIVGVELTIESLEGIWKVSQNRDMRDRAGVQEGLLREQTADADALSRLVGNA